MSCTDDLFGADDTALLFAEHEARYAASQRRELLQAVQRLNAALSKGDALSLKGDFAKQLGITDTNNKDQIKAAIITLKQRALAWENYYTDPALYQEAHEAAKLAMAEATPLFEQADGSFLASPAKSAKDRAYEEGITTLDEETLELASKPMPDVTKGELEKPKSTHPTSWGNVQKRVLVVNNESIDGFEFNDTKKKMLRTTLVQRAIESVKAQPNYIQKVEKGVTTHYLTLDDGVKMQIALGGLRHGNDRRLAQLQDTLLTFGEVANASVEVPGEFKEWHYRVAAVHYDEPAIVLLTLKEQGGRERVTDVQILKGVNLKKENGHDSSPGLIPQKSAPTTTTIADLQRAWEEVFLPGLIQHRPELKSYKSTVAVKSPVRPQGEGRGVAADGTAVVAGERLVQGGAYPFRERTIPLGGAPNSPAMQKGLVKLSTFDLVQIYKDLSGGRVPEIKTHGMRNALGRYWLDKNLIELRSQIFGLADETDIAAIRQRLREVGFYRNLDPKWCEEQRAKVRKEKDFKKLLKAEEERSEREMGKHLKKLVDIRVRMRVNDGAVSHLGFRRQP